MKNSASQNTPPTIAQYPPVLSQPRCSTHPHFINEAIARLSVEELLLRISIILTAVIPGFCTIKDFTVSFALPRTHFTMSFEGFYSLTVAVYSLIYSLIRGIYSLTTTIYSLIYSLTIAVYRLIQGIYSLIYLPGLYLNKSLAAAFCGLLIIVVLSPNRIRNAFKYAISLLNPKSTHPNFDFDSQQPLPLPTTIYQLKLWYLSMGVA